MTNISILGSGRVATVLATKLTSAGYEVAVGTRSVADAAAKWTGPPVTFSTPAEAARTSSITINATPGDTSLERLSALREDLSGKILVDVSNAAERGPDGMPGNLVYPNSSLAEHLQEALPGTSVVKTLNTMLFSVITDPHSLKISPTAFMSGNDAEAKAAVRKMLNDLGWPSDWIEDLGGISSARGTEALFLLVPFLIRSRGFAPFALTVAR